MRRFKSSCGNVGFDVDDISPGRTGRLAIWASTQDADSLMKVLKMAVEAL
jgi:hypothetical protein